MTAGGGIFSLLAVEKRSPPLMQSNSKRPTTESWGTSKDPPLPILQEVSSDNHFCSESMIYMHLSSIDLDEEMVDFTPKSKDELMQAKTKEEGEKAEGDTGTMCMEDKLRSLGILSKEEDLSRERNSRVDTSMAPSSTIRDARLLIEANLLPNKYLWTTRYKWNFIERKGGVLCFTTILTLSAALAASSVTKAAGGVGVIIAKNPSGSVSPCNDFPCIQADYQAGTQILYYIRSSRSPVVKVIQSKILVGRPVSSKVAYFSSKEPSSVSPSILNEDCSDSSSPEVAEDSKDSWTIGRSRSTKGWVKTGLCRP